MAIQKLSDGRWRVDVEPIKGKRHRKTVKTKGEALRFESHIRAQYAGTTAKDWNPAPVDKRRLSELVELWYQHHGINLVDAKRRHSSVVRLTKALGDPVARKLTPSQYLGYRHRRIKAGVSPKTLNNELGYLNAVYNYLWGTDQIGYQSPLIKVKPIKQKEKELTFLTLEQCRELLDKVAFNPSLYLATRLCLETGARWGEALNLSISQVGQGRVTYTDTKSGKNRTVPISADLETAIREHAKGQFQVFNTSINAFRRALAKCSFKLPKGQAAHALRHTYASHFMMNGGDILTLQRILGHSSIALTMRYAHLSPQHLAGAVQFRPKLDELDSMV
ncbi:phage integrase [Marinimicrobium sp. C2-29]|uniref:phage integrase n=1 Tax=Marinimicrobium sp. C2-29 TaxID=3139825 RepID=UPI00313865F1